MTSSNLSFNILFSCLLTLATTTHAEVIYHKDFKNTLGAFQQFLEGPLSSQNRPIIKATRAGIIAQASTAGGFTLFKFRDLKTKNFNLKAVFQIPNNIRYANSGIYLLYTDPTVPVRDELPVQKRIAYDAAIQGAKERSLRYGAGPYEADFFARELQIIAGSEPNLPADNHGPGAFYGVQPVSQGDEVSGTQGHSPYDLLIGDTYELTMESRELHVKTYLRSVEHQRDRVLVSSFINVDKHRDPIRGGSPIALLLQAFPNNGSDVKSPVFHEISVEEF